MAMHVGESVVAALEAEGHLLVIQPHQMQDRRVQIVDVYRVLDDLMSEFIGFSVGHTRLEPGTGHPHGKCVSLMISSGDRLLSAQANPLSDRRPAELGGTNHKRLIQ